MLGSSLLHLPSTSFIPLPCIRNCNPTDPLAHKQQTKASVYVHICAASQGSKALHKGCWSGTMGWRQPLDIVWGLGTVMGLKEKKLMADGI